MTTAELLQARKASLRGSSDPCRCNYTGPQWKGADGRTLSRCAHCGGKLPTRINAPALTRYAA